MLSVKNISLIDFAFGCFLLSVTLLPLGFGGNRPFPIGLAQCGLAISALVLVFEKHIIATAFWPQRIKITFILFGMVFLWAFLQTQSFMPASWHHPLWQESAKLLNQPLEGRIALWQQEAFLGMSRLLTYIVAGVLAYLFAQDSKRAGRMVEALWYAGIAICLYGYVNMMLGNDTVLWLQKNQYVGDFTATFINKNHYAPYAGMVLLCGVALLYQSWRRAAQEMKPRHKAKAIAAWMQHKAFMPFLLIMVVFGSLVLAHSRAGLLCSLIGLGAFFFLYQLYAKNWKGAFSIFIATSILLVGLFLYAVQNSDHFAKLFSDQSSYERQAVYQLSLDALRDNPWLGYGLGSFQPVFRLYNHGLAESFDCAHSDVLESLVDLGLPAGLMLWAAIALLCSGLLHGVLTRRRHGVYPVLGLAAALVVISHAAVDFSLQIPGVAVTLAMLMGVGLAQSWGSSHKAV